MSKLDWSRASEPFFDPARVQRRDDFLPPDQPKHQKVQKRKPAIPLTPEQLRKLAAKTARVIERKEEKRRKKVAAKVLELERQKKNAASKAEQKKANAEKKRLKEAERQDRVVARKAAFEAYKKTPEYAAKLAREQAKVEAMKKSHLEVWVEQETGLSADRDSLREQWRNSLLKRPTAKE